MVIRLDIIQTLAVAVIVLFVGGFVKKYVKILEKLCIPDPVVGGLLFSLFTLIGHSSGMMMFELDNGRYLKSVCLSVFWK